jgi:hypothetical protein
MRKRLRRPSAGTVLGLVALVVATAGAAFAAIPDSGGTIHACYQKGNGNLRVAESSADCRNSEAPLAWSQSGALPGAVKMYVSHSSAAATQFVTLYEIPGFLRIRYRCEELPDQYPGEDLKLETWEIRNLQQDAPLLVRQGLRENVDPGATKTQTSRFNLPNGTGDNNLDLVAYGGGSKAAQGRGTFVTERDCAISSSQTQAISNVIG